MGMESGFSRRRFLQAITGATTLAAVSSLIPTSEAEAAEKRTERPHPVLGKLRFTEKGYGKIERKPGRNFMNLVPKNLKIIPQHLKMQNGPHILGRIDGADLLGTKEEVRAGRLERALRFKNITDAVELRYNLPPGIILAMVMQESHGADMNPNALNDGGIGLAHMQPSEAQKFGLETYYGNSRMKDRKHGRVLREQIKIKKGDVFALAKEDDDRFNRVLNLDAVGRMLATYMSGPLLHGHGPLETAIMRYAGRYNFRRYWRHLSERMAELHNPGIIAQVASDFDSRNKNLTINGISASAGHPPFTLYLEAFWRENEVGFDLATYKKLAAYKPINSAGVLNTYRSQLIKKRP